MWKSLQHFQYCRVWLSLGILMFSVLSPHQRCLCRVEAVKSRPVHSIRDVIFPIHKDHYCCACGIFSFNFSEFSSWVVSIFLLEYCWITLRIFCLLFNLSFDVLSVICRLHNLWSPFKIPFYLVPPIVFSFKAHAVYFLGTKRCFSWNGTEVSIEGSMITAVWTHLRMFLDSKFNHFMF
jgi:hypothetical protein